MPSKYLQMFVVAALSVFIVLLTGVSSGYGQAVSTVQISGTVQDTTRAVIPGARVTATQTEKAFSRTVVTGPDGSYAITQLPVGPYTLRVEKSGFKAFVRNGIVLQVGDKPRLNVTLELGNTRQSVQVSAGAEMVQTRQTAVSSVIDQRRMVQLPLNGRHATQLIILAGAATPSRNGGATTSKNYPSSVALSVAGATGNSTNYLMDGADNEDAFSNVNQPFPFPDALQEFSVETSVTSAAYGVRPGATVNVITKSGTNQFHGDVFDFLRNGALNARNFFASKQDTLKRNQFGGTIGGPIRKDKLFFFAGYQGTRNRQAPPSTLAFVPTAAMLNGDFTAVESAACQSGGARTLTDPNTGQPFSPANQIDPTRFSPAAVALATQYLPKTSDPCGAIRFGIPTTGDEDQEIGRVDWNVSSKQSLFGRYFVTDFRNPAVFDGKNLLPTTRPGILDRAQNFVLGDTYSLSPNLVNSLHLRFSRTRIDRGPSPNLINPADVGVKINPLVPNFIDLSLTGDFAVGCGICAPGFFNDNSYQVADDVDYILGKHQLAFGGEYFKNQLNWLANTLSNGQFTFNGQFTGDPLADFLLGRISSVGRGSPLGPIYMRENIISLYGQDTWRLKPNITLNLGMRWEPLLPEYAKYNQGVVFNRAAYLAGTHTQVFDNAPPGFFYFGDQGIPRSFAHRDWNNFAPRFGIAWHPKSNSDTLVRGAFGIFYQQPQMFYIERFSQVPPFGNLVTLQDPTGGFDNPLQQLGGDPFPLPSPPPKDAFFIPFGSYISMPADLRMPTPYMAQWNLVVQRQIGSNWLVSASYIGNKTTHIWNQNQGNPAVFLGAANSTIANTNQRRELYLANPAPDAGGLVGTLALADPGGNANYNGLILSVNHRFTRSFSIMANYTYSHCLDQADNSGDLAFPQYQNPKNRNADYGNCTFDHRHIFNTSFLYRTPSDWGNPTVDTIMKNWEMSVIASSYSGDYLNPVSGRDNSRTGVGHDRPNVTGPSRLSNRTISEFFNTSVFSQNALGTFGDAGRNSILGPAFINFDLGVSRRIKLTESKNLEIRSEFFNVFNHTNFEDPSTRLTSNTFGELTGAFDPRILQFALKLHF